MSVMPELSEAELCAAVRRVLEPRHASARRLAKYLSVDVDRVIDILQFMFRRAEIDMAEEKPLNWYESEWELTD